MVRAERCVTVYITNECHMYDFCRHGLNWLGAYQCSTRVYIYDTFHS